jgi:hypothetical protein
MKLIELKALREDKIYKKILDELKIRGLENLYIKKTKTVDYLDIILAVIDFLEINKKVVKKITQEQFENIVIIIIVEILEELNINTTEEQLEKILKLLKNSLLVQKASKFLIDKCKYLLSMLTNKCCNKSIKDNVVDVTSSQSTSSTNEVSENKV